MTIATIKDMVLRRIDEAAPSIAGGEAALYNIEEFIDDATLNIIQQAPPHLLPVKAFTEPPIANGDGSGEIPLPSDMVRIVEFWLTGWKRPAKIISAASSEYANQFNKYLRGGATKPVAVIIPSVGGQALRYFSLEPGEPHTVKSATYVPWIRPEELKNELVYPMVWLAASLFFIITNEANCAAMCQKRYDDLLRQLHGIPVDGDRK